MLSTMYPYLLDQVDQHVPLTTVLDWTRQEVLNEARVSRRIKRGNDILQNAVGLNPFECALWLPDPPGQSRHEYRQPGATE